MRILSLIAVMVLFVSSLAAPSRADMVDDCNQDYDRGLSIGGCTAVIRSGQWQGKELAPAYNSRGVAYYLSGYTAQAIEDFNQALRLDPGLVLAYNSRGSVYYDLGDYAQAIENLDQALRLDPGYALAYYNRGNAYRAVGDHARAIEDFDQALLLDPGDDEAYDNRAQSRCLLGMIEASLDDRMQAIRLGATTAKVYQQILLIDGFYKGTIDGNFGAASQQALREWTAAGCPEN